MRNDTTRRAVLTGLATAPAVAALPAFALTEAAAERLVRACVDDINAVINSGRSEAAMYREFERIFERYGDVPTISRFVLGPIARGASRSELAAFSEEFKGYMARKYGKRFRELIGGRVTVEGVSPVNSFFEVQATASLPGQSPFSVSFMVSDRSGSDRFFDMRIEGISLLRTEQTEIGTMLDRRGGSIARLTADLARVG